MRQFFTEGGMALNSGSWIVLTFFFIFVGLIVHVFRKKNGEKYAKLARIPLDEESL